MGTDKKSNGHFNHLESKNQGLEVLEYSLVCIFVEYARRLSQTTNKLKIDFFVSGCLLLYDNESYEMIKRRALERESWRN